METNKTPSEFAQDVSKIVKSQIKARFFELEQENKILQAKILQWYQMTKDKTFREYFGIKTERLLNEKERGSC